MTENTATIAACLRVHGSLTTAEFDEIAHHWAPLETRLRGFDENSVGLDLYIKERDTASQHLTLEAKIANWPVLIATTSEQDFEHALNVVRDEMIRLVTDAKEMHRPRQRAATRRNSTSH